MIDSFSDFLEHYGKKGMKWGVRNDGTSGPKPTRADKVWQKNIYSVHGAIAIHNEVANRMNYGGLDKLNAKHKNNIALAKGDENHPAFKKYIADYLKMNEEFTAKAVNDIHGTSPSGGYKATLDTSNPEQWAVKISPVEVKHAEVVIPTLIMEIEHDNNGMITLVKSVKEQVMSQSDVSNFAEYLEHYGKKGMKWGVRKTPVKTSSDYKKTANLRRKNPKTLTNKQIQAVNARIKLEKSYKQNNPHPIARGLKVAGAIVSAVGTATAVYNLRNNPILKDAVSTGSKLALKMVKESKNVPFEQLTLFK